MNEDLPRWPRLAVAAAAVVGLGVGVAGTAVVVGLADGDGTREVDAGAISLVAYDSCESALSELKAAALPQVGAYGMAGDLDVARGGEGDVAIADGAPQAAPGAAEQAPPYEVDAGGAKSAAEPNAAPDHSGTNNYESGVDEPDIVKTDGKRVVTVADGTLRVVAVAGHKQTAKLALPMQPGGYPSELLISGDRALVLTLAPGVPVAQPGGVAEPGIAPGEPVPDASPPIDEPVKDAPDASPPIDTPAYGMQLVLVDLTGAGKVLGTLQVEGGYLDARQVGSVARVVVHSAPRLKFTYPNGTFGTEEAAARNRHIVESSSISDWLPRYQLTADGHRSSGELVDCTAVSHPASYTGASMLTILTVDLTRELGAGDPISIAADGNTVYGSGPNLYVADDHLMRGVGFGPRPGPTDRPAPAEQRTEIYQFDVSGAGRPVHVASGSVSGSLLNQYSLSEHDGNLRVATTMAGTGESHSGISVLTRRGKTLAQVGRIDGLGRGEQIYAVRFLGDKAYVVTFRQTDPLYTVDLSVPAKPRLTGELKITGYSSYLHPVGDGRLLGVGQEATTDGLTTGTQVSLFDVSGQRDARSVSRLEYLGAHSEVEGDPHAFLYWPDKDLVVIPMQGGTTAEGTSRSGALVVKVTANTMTEVGTIMHKGGDNEYYDAPRRALVIGDEIWTLSSTGMMVSDLDSLSEVAWLPFT
jgi:beta propeller domain-containing protein